MNLLLRKRRKRVTSSKNAINDEKFAAINTAINLNIMDLFDDDRLPLSIRFCWNSPLRFASGSPSEIPAVMKRFLRQHTGHIDESHT